MQRGISVISGTLQLIFRRLNHDIIYSIISGIALSSPTGLEWYYRPVGPGGRSSPSRARASPLPPPQHRGQLHRRNQGDPGLHRFLRREQLGHLARDHQGRSAGRGLQDSSDKK